jgi:hypothetical protein
MLPLDQGTVKYFSFFGGANSMYPSAEEEWLDLGDTLAATAEL